MDNGSGLTIADLKQVGSRYVTSKCHTVEDIEQGRLNCHGYRGEALASLRETCAILQITSKSSLSEETHVALFIRGRRKPVEKAAKDRIVHGTTVIIGDFFYNMPVR